MADNTVTIKIKAQNQTDAAFKQVTGSLKGLVEGITGMSISSVAGTAAIYGIGKALRDTVADTMKYAKQVRDLSDVMRTSTEETSRIIQVADDYMISTESLTRAMEMALKNGFAPSVDTLADLADRYVSIQDPTARAAEMQKIFGRNWAELTPMLREGGQAIRDGAAAISESLVLTQQQVDQARRLEIQIDNLNDAWEGIKTTVGNAVVPVLANVAQQVNYNMQAQAALKAQMDVTTMSHQQQIEWMNAYIDRAMAVDFANQSMKNSYNDVAGGVEGARRATEDYNYALGENTNLLKSASDALIAQGMDASMVASIIQALSGGLDMNAVAQSTFNRALRDGTQAVMDHRASWADLMNYIRSWDGTRFTADFVVRVSTVEVSDYINTPYGMPGYDWSKTDKYTVPSSGGHDTSMYPTGGGGGGGGGGYSLADLAAREAERAAREAEQKLQEEIRQQQSYLSILISGNLGEQVTDYNQKQVDLKQQQLDLMKKIAGYESLVNPNERLRGELSQLQDQLKAVNEEIEKSGEAHDEATKKILFNLLQQQLQMDGLTKRESDLLVGLAEKWGMVDQATLDAWKLFSSFGTDINNNGTSIQSIIEAITAALGAGKAGNSYTFNYTGNSTAQAVQQTYEMASLLG